MCLVSLRQKLVVRPLLTVPPLLFFSAHAGDRQWLGVLCFWDVRLCVSLSLLVKTISQELYEEISPNLELIRIFRWKVKGQGHSDIMVLRK